MQFNVELGQRLREARKSRGWSLLEVEGAQAWMQSAVEQSRRGWVTIIDPGWCSLGDLGEFVAADRGGAAFRPDGSITVAIGPEGGFIPYEIEKLSECGFQSFSLGPRILRVETAVPVILSRLMPS